MAGHAARFPHPQPRRDQKPSSTQLAAETVAAEVEGTACQAVAVVGAAVLLVVGATDAVAVAAAGVVAAQEKVALAAAQEKVALADEVVPHSLADVVADTPY